MTTATANPSPTRIAEIRRSLELLHEPGDVFEVRALDVPSGKYKNVVSGYFDCIGKATQAIARLDKHGRPKGIYVTVNPCNPALLSRANNRLIERPKSTTQDGEILRRRWFFVDLDPHRPSGIAATDVEVDTARKLAAEVEERLRARGWPFPLIAESGNGAYLLWRVDLPNDDASTELIKRCYAGINQLLDPYDPSKPHATLDTGNFNAARIIRVGGTLNRKGDSTPDRPHRVCRYFEPDPEQPVEVVL